MAESHMVRILRIYSPLLIANPWSKGNDLKQIYVLISETRLIDLWLMPQPSNADFAIRVVCVVGAGISGLRCAEVLAQQGLKVTILEARDRIGGRVSCLDGLECPVGLTYIRSTSPVYRAI